MSDIRMEPGAKWIEIPAKIVKVLRPIKYGPEDKYAIATVRLDDGSESSVYIGGEVEEYYHAGKSKAHIKRTRSIDKVQGNKVQ